MAERLSASICINDIYEASKAGHSAINTAKNGKKYANIVIWINDNKDKFDNDISIQLNSHQDKRETEGKVYIGNGKTGRLPALPDTLAPDASTNETNDLPF
jgi:hypothetical protein